MARGNLAEGFQTFCHFQVDVCLQKIPESSQLGQSIGMSLVFMLKEPCDGISIHDEYWENEKKKKDELPAFLICNTHYLSLPTIYTPSLFQNYISNL